MSEHQTTRLHPMKSRYLRAAALFVILAVGGLLAWWTVGQTDRQMRADLLQQAQLVARAVDMGRIRDLSGSPADLTKPDYLQLKEQLASIRSAIPQCRFIYLIGRNTDGALFFFVDSEPAGSADYSPPGQLYSEAPEGYHRIFVTRNAGTEGPYTDRWGTWVSGLVPLQDQQTVIYGLATQADARAMVRKAVDFSRQYGRDRLLEEINNPRGEFRSGDLYAFAYDRTMTMLAHPVKPELVGQNLLDKKDWSGGKYFRREIQHVALSKGNGWVDYEYENPATKQRDPKTTYVELADDLIICAGAYKGTGSTLAVLGMDINARTWNWMLFRAALPSLLLTLMLAALLLAASALLARRSRIAGTPPTWMLRLEPAIVVAAGLALTLFMAWMLHQREDRDRTQAFLQLATNRTDGIAEILHDLRNTKLDGLAHFYESSVTVTAEEFRRFTAYLTENPALQAWEWIPAVPAADKPRFEAQARTTGLQGFEIWQKDAGGKKTPAGGRTVYYPIFQVVPLAGNESALGYDLGSEPLRRAALEEAIGTRLPTGTDPITLVQERANQKGMLVYHPVFMRTIPGSKQTGSLRGFIVAALRMGTLLRSAAPDSSVLMELSLLHKGRAPELLATSWDAENPPSIALSATRPVLAFGKVLTVTAHAGPEFIRLHPTRLGWVTALTGLLLTAAIALVIGVVLRRRYELEQLVDQRTHELQQSETRIRAITDSAQDAIVMMDTEGKISFWNQAAEAILGYTNTEAIGRDLHTLLVPQRYQNAYNAAFPTFQQTGQGAAVGKTLDVTARKKDGREIDIQISLSAIQLHGYWHAVGIARDITERKKAETELMEINRRLETATARANDMAAQAAMANAAKSDFLANMSHEIRTPMNGVIGVTGLLLDTDLTDEQRHYTEIVRSSGELLLCLINDILDFSKIEAGKLDLEILDFDLRDLLDDFAAMLALRAHDKRLEFICVVAPDVPVYLRGDAGRLRQILNNLAGNAVKFTHKGEIAVLASLVMESDGETMIRFSIKDTGIGIPAHKRNLLFQKFSQMDASTTRTYGGTGLGLAISKQLVGLMNGEIGVESEEGSGSEFWFTAHFPKQAEQEHTAAPRIDISGLHVLVVDDTAMNRKVLMAQLRAWEVLPEEAPDGPLALQALRLAKNAGNPFPVAILDMQMPGMDGAALARAIKADEKLKDTRLVLYSAMGQRGDTRQLQEMGFAAYLPKPAAHADILDCLSAALTAGSRGEEEQPGGARHRKRETLNLFAGRKARILLADDNITNQEVAVGMLKKLGLHADAVANGVEAVTAVETIPYDLVLMDVQMPEMDGFEATRLIRRALVHNQHVPIIAMTAHAMQGDRDKCLDAGMNGYITKPISLRALADALDKWLPPDGAAIPEQLSGESGDAMTPPGGTAEAEPAGPLF